MKRLTRYKNGNGSRGHLNPLPLSRMLEIDEVEEQQKLYCRHRNTCLTIASAWPAFSCNGCRAFVHIDPAEIADQTDCLLNLVAAVRGVRIPMKRGPRAKPTLK
jgi:hypothetical protein